jgi:hypothetical protein
VPKYQFVGGPCAGAFLDTGEPTLPVGTVQPCGNHYYQLGADGKFHDAGTTAPKGPPAEKPVDVRQVGRAWHKLTHVLSVESAQELRRSRAGRARAKRVVR